MQIGGVDTATTSRNIKVERNCWVSSSSISPDSNFLAFNTELRDFHDDFSSESEPEVASDSEMTYDSESQTSLANASICKLADQHHLSSRSASNLLGEAAVALKSPYGKLLHMTLYRKSLSFREQALVDASHKILLRLIIHTKPFVIIKRVC